MCSTRAPSPFTQWYPSRPLSMSLTDICSSWQIYAGKGSGSMTKNVCCSPPRPSQIIVALLSSNRLRKIMSNSRFASPSSYSTPMTRAGRAASFQRNSAQSYILSCSPLKGPSTPGLSGSIRGWASPAATPNTVYPFFPKRPSRLPLSSTLNLGPVTDITL